MSYRGTSRATSKQKTGELFDVMNYEYRVHSVQRVIIFYNFGLLFGKLRYPGHVFGRENGLIAVKYLKGSVLTA